MPHDIDWEAACNDFHPAFALVRGERLKPNADVEAILHLPAVAGARPGEFARRAGPRPARPSPFRRLVPELTT